VTESPGQHCLTAHSSHNTHHP